METGTFGHALEDIGNTNYSQERQVCESNYNLQPGWPFETYNVVLEQLSRLRRGRSTSVRIGGLVMALDALKYSRFFDIRSGYDALPPAVVRQPSDFVS